MKKVLNQPPEAAKAKFFQLLDVNEDGRVCEKDIFDTYMKLNDRYLHDMIAPDLYKILDHIQMLKEKLGKTDQTEQKLNKIKEHVRQAERDWAIIEPKNPR